MSDAQTFTPRIYLREPTEKLGQVVAHWVIQTDAEGTVHTIDLDPMDVTQMIEKLAHMSVRHAYLKDRRAKGEGA